jgi:hypothetical protein
MSEGETRNFCCFQTTALQASLCLPYFQAFFTYSAVAAELL